MKDTKKSSLWNLIETSRPLKRQEIILANDPPKKEFKFSVICRACGDAKEVEIDGQMVPCSMCELYRTEENLDD